MKGEFEFIDGIRRMFPVPDGMLGIGDDCAILPQEQGMETLVSTDMLVEGTHFLMEDISPYRLGWKSAASNFSDIAAMGGEPAGCFLALALPHKLPDGWEQEFLRGLHDISERYGFPLLGGDTTSSPDRVCICLTVLGRTASGQSRRRSMAVPGDLVCTTGVLGDSAAGLEAILRKLPRTSVVPYLIDKHYLPQPRIEEGRMLAQTPGVHAMMDISDGIGSDLRHIMEESHVGAEIDTDRLPMSGEMRDFCSMYDLDPCRFAASGGEDYELLFTVDPAAEASLGVPHSVIGRITEGDRLVWKGTDSDYEGFRHF